MDIDAYEKHIRRLIAQVEELLAFKARVEPMFAAMLPEWEKFQAGTQGDELQDGDETPPVSDDAPAPEDGAAPDAPEEQPVSDEQSQPGADPVAETPLANAGNAPETLVPDEPSAPAEQPETPADDAPAPVDGEAPDKTPPAAA